MKQKLRCVLICCVIIVSLAVPAEATGAVHKTVYKPVEEQQIIPNMQEQIISEDLFDRVQELRKNKRRPTKTGKKSLFLGLLYCPNCGVKMHFCAAKSLKPN